VAEAPTEIVAGVEIGAPFIVFPYLVVERLARLLSQRTVFENVPLRVTIQLEEARLLRAIVAIGENDQDFALHSAEEYGGEIGLSPPFSPSGLAAVRS
jgi:hypothetical protein